MEQDEEAVGAAEDNPMMLPATVAAQLAERPELLALRGRRVGIAQVRAIVAQVISRLICQSTLSWKEGPSRSMASLTGILPARSRSCR